MRATAGERSGQTGTDDRIRHLLGALAAAEEIGRRPAPGVSDPPLRGRVDLVAPDDGGETRDVLCGERAVSDADLVECGRGRRAADAAQQERQKGSHGTRQLVGLGRISPAVPAHRTGLGASAVLLLHALQCDTSWKNVNQEDPLSSPLARSGTRRRPASSTRPTPSSVVAESTA